jgi:methylation protein EvaC
MQVTPNNPIGKFERRKTCRFCNSSNLTCILDFGDVPLAGGFLNEKEFQNEKFYPLNLNLCQDCFLVQASDVVPAEVLFQQNYFFFSSAIGTLVSHFEAFAQDVHSRFLADKPEASAFELGCNDGVLLKPLASLGVRAVGVDPATNVVNSIDSKNFTVVNDFFSEKCAQKIRKEHGQFDVFLSSYSFAHIDNMIDIMKGVKCLLNDDGVLVIEIYYLGTLIDGMQYDMIYHEHMNYYSLKSLRSFLSQFDMEIFDLQNLPGIRSGSVRFYARNIGQRSEPISPAVSDMDEYEESMGFNEPSTYSKYAARVNKTRLDLLEMLDKIKSEGKTVIGYGASGRGTVIMNYCGIDGRHLDYVVDDAPAKQGFFTPGTHVPIKSWDFVDESEKFPDFAILFAWAFTDEVIKKRQDYINNGGKFIIPLPTVRVFPE